MSRQGPANGRQVGGDHYRKWRESEQHWDRQWRLFGAAWFIGNITKYVERYQNKDGLKDLEKARHYLDKLIELELTKQSEGLAPDKEFPPYRQPWEVPDSLPSGDAQGEADSCQ